MSLEHGGRLRAAATHYGVPLARWLDLSTGISPWPYRPGPVPESVWQRLPEEDDGLLEAATAFYGTRRLVATPGSQAALQTLPRLRPPGRVAVTAGSYAEHAAAWREAGHQVEELDDAALPTAADRYDAVVVVNPDNPTGRRIDPAVLLGLHARLAARGGWLVLDEAFMDGTPRESLAPLAGLPGLVVLRSLGKFFGLAGLRLGFAGLPAEIAAALAARLGPWAVSHPARWAGRRALADVAWHRGQCARLTAGRERLDAALTTAGMRIDGGTELFRYCRHPRAGAIADALARDGILVRRFADPPALRLGLAETEAEWQRLEKALPVAVGAA